MTEFNVTSNAHLTAALVSLYPLTSSHPPPLTLFCLLSLLLFLPPPPACRSVVVVKVNFFFRFSLAIAVAHISALFKRARGGREGGCLGEVMVASSRVSSSARLLSVTFAEDEVKVAEEGSRRRRRRRSRSRISGIAAHQS